MGRFNLALIGVVLAFSACNAAPHYPQYSSYVEPIQYYYPYQHRPAVFAPLPPPSRRTAPDATVASLSPLIHNYISYKVDPDAEPDEPLEVAQFHSQDAAGRVVFGFNTPYQSRMEARSLDGTVRGSYSYQDPTGKTVKMHYWDDGTGFHTMGNNLPAGFFSPPSYTPEVQAARERHLQLYREALTAALASGGGSEEEATYPDSSEGGVQTEALTTPDAIAVAAHDSADVGIAEGVESDSDDDSVAIESSAYARRVETPRVTGEPEAARKQIAHLAQITDLTLDNSPTLAIARIGSDGYQYLVPVAAPASSHSESSLAARFGAIPVAAVHDAQVSPAQSKGVDDHQLKPVLIRTFPTIY